MKYEYEPEDANRKQVVKALVRLRSEFAGAQHAYIDVRLALETFVQQDFTLDDTSSSRYIEQLEREGILPAARLFDEDSEVALRMHRRAMVAHWMPLYRELHADSERFKVWVPQLLEVAVPRGDVHTSACRDGRLLSALGSAAVAPCAISNDCPVNTIAAQVLQQTPFLPLYPEEYAVFDADQAQSDALSLLQAVAGRKFIDPHETREAVRDVREMYHYLTA